MKRGASRVSTPQVGGRLLTQSKSNATRQRTALPKPLKAPVPGYPPGPAARGTPSVPGLNQANLGRLTPNSQALVGTRKPRQFVTTSTKPGRGRVPGG